MLEQHGRGEPAKAIYTENAERLTKEADDVQARLTDVRCAAAQAMECAAHKGGSSVLTTAPIGS